MNFKLIAACAMTMSIAGCSSDSATTAAGVSVIAVNGKTVTLDGKFTTTCYLDNSVTKNRQDTHTFSGNTLTISSSTWPTNDACATAGTVDYTYVFTVTAGSNITITGWADGSGTDVVAPLAADNLGGSLDVNETVTPLSGTVTSVTPVSSGLAVGDVTTFFYVVDNSGVDTGSNLYLYRDKDYAAGDTRATAVDRLFL